jgi:hypothetical protein
MGTWCRIRATGGVGKAACVPLQSVIPGHREAMSFDVQLHIRESITTIVSMDSGQPLRGFRNDEIDNVSTVNG